MQTLKVEIKNSENDILNGRVHKIDDVNN